MSRLTRLLCYIGLVKLYRSFNFTLSFTINNIENWDWNLLHKFLFLFLFFLRLDWPVNHSYGFVSVSANVECSMETYLKWRLKMKINIKQYFVWKIINIICIVFRGAWIKIKIDTLLIGLLAQFAVLLALVVIMALYVIYFN